MSAPSTDTSSGVDNFASLLRELSRLQAQNRKLRRRAFIAERSRDYWKTEAQTWKWGALKR